MPADRADRAPGPGRAPAPRRARPPWILRPALLAADRMRTSLRLGALVLVLVVPGLWATVEYTAEVNSKIAFSALEREGTEVVRPALVALADAAAGRTPDLAPLRAAVEAHPALKLGDALAAVPTASGTPPAEVAAALAAVVTATGNNSNLILDPDLDSFYVMDVQIVQLPRALVAAAEAAAGNGDATGNDAVAAQAVRAGTLTGTADSLRTDLTTAADTTAMTDLATRLAPVAQAADAIGALGETLAGGLARPGPADPVAAADAVRAAVPAVVDVLNDLLDTRVAGFAQDRAVVLAVAVGGFVVGAWFAAAVLWRTRHDVALALTGVTAIAEGDFGERPLPAGGDELGTIGRALATARERLVAQDAALRSAQEVRERQMRSSFRHQREAELGLRDRAQAIIDESTGVIAGELREVTAQVADVRRAADTIDHGISATDAATAAVVDHARRAEDVITSLEESLRRVAATAALVTGIAGQTRLLALNATIEAARAGDLGLGFTVVADEVKELATTTARSTEQITETIGQLERETAAMSDTIAAMVTSIGSVGESATELRSVAADQGELVVRLADRMTQTIDRVEQMSGLAAQLERRRADRVAASGPVRVRLPGAREALETTLLDVSRGGLRCTLPDGAPGAEGDTVQVELGTGEDRFAVRARLVNRRHTDDGDQAGLEFLPTDRHQEERIAGYVDTLLRGVNA